MNQNPHVMAQEYELNTGNSKYNTDCDVCEDIEEQNYYDQKANFELMK